MGSKVLFIVPFVAVSLMAAPGSNLPAVHETMDSATGFCGDVQAVDLFAQTVRIKPANEIAETVPFSRWTDFFRISSHPVDSRRVETIDPTEVKAGDRICVLLDPQGATANAIELLPGRAPVSGKAADQIARNEHR